MIQKFGFSAAAIVVGLSIVGCGSQQAAPLPGSPATSAAAESHSAASMPGSTAAGDVGMAGVITDAEKVLNVYNWSDYIVPDLLTAFEKRYGIKINYDVFDSNEVLETKLLAGKTGYDVVVPTGSFLQRQIKAGVFQKLDKSLLPNLKNVDPEMAKHFEVFDPGHEYGVNYIWLTSGVGYNVDKIKAAMPDAPVDSFRMFYDPAVTKNFKDCGVTLLDAPDEIVSTVLVFLGRDPTSEKPEDLAAAEKVLTSIRPYVRYFNSSKYIEDLANGETCLALGWGGDVGQSATRAREAKNGITIKYNIPKEGALLLFDMMAIPADAAHPKNAHLFLNYLLSGEVAARNASVLHYAVSNSAAYPLIDPVVYNDRGIFPSVETKAHLHPNLAHSQAYTRLLTRMWTKLKAGR